ncbi:MAG: hypothetical protein IH968_13770 [Gemmatimonadetes bacterium]|nr:hypothetical protein [Gemmatimonadota bacterium]
MSPAIWSAIAAWGAAVSSFLLYLILRQELQEAVRPQLVLTNWSRTTVGEGEQEHDVIEFKGIKNVGRGAALNTMIFQDEFKNPPTVTMGMERVGILAPSEEVEVDGQITLWWKNVEMTVGESKMLPITIKILSWDTRSMRHETQYKLVAFQPPMQMSGAATPIAPGVYEASRTTKARPVWRLKMKGRIERAFPSVRKGWRWLRRADHPSGGSDSTDES